MTHRPIRTEADGTRVYASGHRYKPMADEDRTYKVRKPDHPDAVRWHTVWLLPLDLLPVEERVLPATRPFRERNWT